MSSSTPTEEELSRPGGLADRLHQLRRGAGVTGDDLASRLGWPRAKVSKLETGRQMPTTEDVRPWAAAFAADEEVTSELLRLLTDATTVHRQWRHQLRSSGSADLQLGIEDLMAGAGLIRNFELYLIPGILQTAGYARARMLEAVQVHGFDAAGVDAAVAARMRRQEVLHDGSKHFELVVMEDALAPLLAPPDVMAGQLDRLLGLAGMPNVTLGIVPTSKPLPLAPLHGFLMLDELVVIETFASSVRLRGEEAATYKRIMGLLVDAAVAGDEARQVILQAARNLRGPR